MDDKEVGNTVVVNVRNTSEPYIYIGRKRQGMHYGNPFIVGIDGDRENCVHWCRLWLKGEAFIDKEPERRQWILDNLERLRGKNLGCFCAPLSCHGDIYVEMLERR